MTNLNFIVILKPGGKILYQTAFNKNGKVTEKNIAIILVIIIAILIGTFLLGGAIGVIATLVPTLVSIGIAFHSQKTDKSISLFVSIIILTQTINLISAFAVYLLNSIIALSLIGSLIVFIAIWTILLVLLLILFKK
ncbi:MAG: hypothetical protein WC470_02685 [Candidatus Paceibacterota bacterium]